MVRNPKGTQLSENEELNTRCRWVVGKLRQKADQAKSLKSGHFSMMENTIENRGRKKPGDYKLGFPKVIVMCGRGLCALDDHSSGTWENRPGEVLTESIRILVDKDSR